MISSASVSRPSHNAVDHGVSLLRENLGPMILANASPLSFKKGPSKERKFQNLNCLSHLAFADLVMNWRNRKASLNALILTLKSLRPLRRYKGSLHCMLSRVTLRQLSTTLLVLSVSSRPH